MAIIKQVLPVIPAPTNPIVDIGSQTNYSTGPFPGQLNKVIPTSGTQTEGFLPGEEPAAENVNYIFNNHYQYLDHLENNMVTIYEYCTPGVYQLTVPANIGAIRCVAVGGGGGGGAGGGLELAGHWYGGGGGGGAGYYVDYNIPILNRWSAAETLYITVADGGVGGQYTAGVYSDGAAGGFSKVSVGSSSNTIVYANGGNGGISPHTTGTPLAGGVGGSGRCGGGGGGAGCDNPAGDDTGSQLGGLGGLGGVFVSSGNAGTLSTLGAGGLGGSGLSSTEPYLLNMSAGIGWRPSFTSTQHKYGGSGGFGGAGVISPVDITSTLLRAGDGQALGRTTPSVRTVPADAAGRGGIGYGAGGGGGAIRWLTTGNTGGSGGKGAPGYVAILLYPTIYNRVTP